MPPSLSSVVFLLPFDDLSGEADCPEDVSPSDPADLISGWGSDDFYIGRRSSASGSNEFSLRQPLRREAESDSDTDSGEQIVAIGDDADLPFCWECLHVVEDGSEEAIEEFDWEDVSTRVDDPEILTVIPFADENVVENTNPNTELNVDWEVLLSVNDNDVESVFVDEGFAYASEYEDLFAQFGDHGSSDWAKSVRPALKSVVDNLPAVQLTEDDLAKDTIYCAVCKDKIFLSDEVKGLPCFHYYHKDCIVPWLVVRNTCPLCRYELPYSESKDATAIDGEEGAQARFEFEILQDT